MNNETIQLIPTEELIKELLHRFDHVAFVGRLHRSGLNIWSRRWRGDRDICTGLVISLLTTIDKQGREGETLLPPDNL